MKFDHIKNLYGDYILNTYIKQDICIVKGTDVCVEDINGKKYIDFCPRWAVSGIGHCNKHVKKMIKNQLERIIHVSNNYYNDVQPMLAKKIIDYSFPGKVFFANSGAEANEGAIKLARKYGEGKRFEIICMKGSFHGRTMATLTATGQDKVKKGFHPLVEGFKHIDFNDKDAFKSAINDKTIAVIIEIIQGEGGINVADDDYLKLIEDVCAKKDMLLIVDEVQTCMGRTGKMFAYQHYGITPSCMTLAKSLAGGLPLGALVVGDKFKDVLTPGTHASTFGGGPVVSAASLGVFEAIEEGNLMENASKMGKYMVSKLEKIKIKTNKIKEIKGKGLMIGVSIDLKDASIIVDKCAEDGLLINCTQNNILRVMPPITVKKEHIDRAMTILGKVINRI